MVRVPLLKEKKWPRYGEYSPELYTSLFRIRVIESPLVKLLMISTYSGSQLAHKGMQRKMQSFLWQGAWPCKQNRGWLLPPLVLLVRPPCAMSNSITVCSSPGSYIQSPINLEHRLFSYLLIFVHIFSFF